MPLPTRQDTPTEDEIAEELKALEDNEDDELKAFESDEEPGSEADDDPDETEDPDDEDEPETPQAKPPVDDTDWKKKFSESSRQAQFEGLKNKKVSTAWESALSLPEPTKEEMIALIPDYEELTEHEQRILKDNEWHKRRFSTVKEAIDASKEIDNWSVKVDDFLNDAFTIQKYPDLEDHAKDFKHYATRPERMGGHLPTIAEAFIGGLPEHLASLRKRKTLMLRGKGGDKPKTPGVYDADTVRLLRTKNPRLYNELVNKGKIKIEA